MRAALGAAVLALAVAAPGVAVAAEATSEQVRALAGRAADEPAALAELRSIDRVDGRPVDLRRALGTRQPDELRARLEALSAGAGSPERGATEEAREVLDQRKYKRSGVPQPLRSPIQRLGDWLRDGYDWLVDRFPGGGFGVWTLFAAFALFLGGLLAGRVIRRHVDEEHASATAARRAGEDPRALEREADAADRAGDHEKAVRLRFRAGLLQLDARGAIDLRPGLTTGAIARQLGSEAFTEVRETFDEIAYGGRTATAEDAAAAKVGWKRVLAERRRDPSPALERAA